MKETNIKAKHLAIFANEYAQCESALDFMEKLPLLVNSASCEP